MIDINAWAREKVPELTGDDWSALGLPGGDGTVRLNHLVDLGAYEWSPQGAAGAWVITAKGRALLGRVRELSDGLTVQNNPPVGGWAPGDVDVSPVTDSSRLRALEYLSQYESSPWLSPNCDDCEYGVQGDESGQYVCTRCAGSWDGFSCAEPAADWLQSVGAADVRRDPEGWIFAKLRITSLGRAMLRLKVGAA